MFCGLGEEGSGARRRIKDGDGFFFFLFAVKGGRGRFGGGRERGDCYFWSYSVI